jgi:hypothetical protein
LRILVWRSFRSWALFIAGIPWKLIRWQWGRHRRALPFKSIWRNPGPFETVSQYEKKPTF